MRMNQSPSSKECPLALPSLSSTPKESAPVCLQMLLLFSVVAVGLYKMVHARLTTTLNKIVELLDVQLGIVLLGTEAVDNNNKLPNGRSYSVAYFCDNVL